MPRQKLKVLVLSDFAGNDANVVRDYLYCFNQHSRHQFFYLHSWSKNNFRRLVNFDFNRFDAIVLFWDFFWIGCLDPLSYCYVPPWVSKRIAASSALKVQFLQDEYRDVRLADRSLNRFGVNVMFSCVAKKDHDLFYPKSLIPSLAATYPVLTGYVPSYLEAIDFPASIDRPIDIGYRSRTVPYYLGSLGQEKVVIAERFQQIADRFGFSANISVREKDRIYGERWLDFMRACRFSLGTESGASVVDFDSRIRQRCQDYLRANPRATFEEVSTRVFKDVDGKVVVQTISPRIFEASAFENTLILHEGTYEGMLQPDVHYISVKKDYSNVQEVVERMRDRSFCERLAQNAKETLIDSRKYNYQSFVKTFDAILEDHVPIRPRSRSVSRTLFYLMNYLNNDRLIPNGGVFLTIPHTCDIVYHYNKSAPYGLIVLYSASLILSLFSQSPRLITKVLGKLLGNCKEKGASAIGLLKDLRILALLFQLRGGVRAGEGPVFDVHLGAADSCRLIASSVPRSADANLDLDTAASGRKAECELVDGMLAQELPFSIQWENRLMGNALPLPLSSPRNYSIYLNEDCVYQFERLNHLTWMLNAEERALFCKLLCGGWKEPTWLAKGCAILFVCWALLGYLYYAVPGRYVASWCRSILSWISRDRSNARNSKVSARD